MKFSLLVICPITRRLFPFKNRGKFQVGLRTSRVRYTITRYRSMSFFACNNCFRTIQRVFPISCPKVMSSCLCNEKGSFRRVIHHDRASKALCTIRRLVRVNRFSSMRFTSNLLTRASSRCQFLSNVPTSSIRRRANFFQGAKAKQRRGFIRFLRFFWPRLIITFCNSFYS